MSALFDGAMVYVFMAAWFIIGIYLLVQGKKIHKVCYVLGVYFLFLGFCWLGKITMGIDLSNGTWGIIIRVISAIMLVFAIAVYIWEKKRSKNNNSSSGN